MSNRTKTRMGRPKSNAGKAGWNGNAMRIVRRLQMVTLEDIAHALGVSTSTVARWEHGEVEPSAAAATQIAKALRVTRAKLGRTHGENQRRRGHAKRKKVQ